MPKYTTEAINQSVTALQSLDFKEAISIRHRAYSENARLLDNSIVRTMELIMEHTPALLIDCPPTIIEPLRIAAAMMELWGTNHIKHFVNISEDWNYHFNALAVALMLHSHGNFLLKLESFRDVGITNVELLGSSDLSDCEACRAADGAFFTIDTVPELPLTNCKCNTKYGCRVLMLARR